MTRTAVLAVHESIGVVSARAQERNLDSIRALEAVSAVEVGSGFQLPLPESDGQQSMSSGRSVPR